MRRDFTFVEDVSEAVVRLLGRPPQGNPNWSGDKPDPATSAGPWKIYNIGNNNPEELLHVVSLLEKEFGRTVVKRSEERRVGKECRDRGLPSPDKIKRAIVKPHIATPLMRYPALR